MKKILLFISCLYSIHAIAQEGFFLQPLLGNGVGNIKLSHIPSKSVKTGFAPAYEMQLGIGYASENFVISAAVAYKQSSYLNNVTFTNALGYPIGTGKFKYYFNHISLPVTVGHRFRTGEHFTITPAIGIMATYNYSGKTFLSSSTIGIPSRKKIPIDNFRKQYNPISAWAVIQVNMDLVVNPRLSIMWAPSFDYMITGINKNASNGIGQHNYTIMLNAGVKWYLHNIGNAGVKDDSKNKE